MQRPDVVDRTRVLRADGGIDGGALQRTIDSVVSKLNQLLASPAGQLSRLPIDVLHGSADPALGLKARLGSIYIRVRTEDDGGPGVYQKTGDADSSWELLAVV